MSGKNLIQTPLAVRRCLLVAESEINRALLVRDYHQLKGELGHTAKNFADAGVLAASAGALFGAFKIFKGHPPQNGTPKSSSWFSTGLELIQIGLPFWMSFHRKKNPANSNTTMKD